MNDSEPPKQKRRWYHLAPWDCFAIGLLAVEASLLLTEWSRLSPHPKGWLGLHAVACVGVALLGMLIWFAAGLLLRRPFQFALDRKSTRLNSSHGYISYAVFCFKKK